jgi:hypothetical protein
MATRITKTQANKARLPTCLEKSLGIVTTACKKANVTRVTYYEYYKKDKEFAKAVDEIQDVTLDFAEGKLLENIQKGSDTAVIFYLKTKGKKRGYIERTENVNVEKESFSDLTEEELEAKIKKLTKDTK